MRKLILGSAAAVGLLVSTSASALTFTWSFTPTYEIAENGTPIAGPYAPLSGRIFGLKEGVNIFDEFTPAVEASVDVSPFASTIGRYFGDGKFVVTGGELVFADAATFSNNDLFIGSQGAGASPEVSGRGPYPDAAAPNGFMTFVAASDVPEPATWVLVLGGFGVVGLAFRRRRETSACDPASMTSMYITPRRFRPA